MIDNFKERKRTNYIYIVPMGISPMSYEEFYNKCWIAGLFGTGYHYFVADTGWVSEDREEDAWADNRFENYDKAIYICVEAENQKETSQVQEEVISRLVNDIMDRHPDESIEVVRPKNWTAISMLPRH